MGYMRHHAILVTSWDSQKLREARNFAVTITGERLVTRIIDGLVNSQATFVVVPDGSKEGWAESDNGDQWRAHIISWIQNQRYDNGSNVLSWAEVQYGDDDRDDKLLRSSHSEASA